MKHHIEYILLYIYVRTRTLLNYLTIHSPVYHGDCDVIIGT